MRSVPEKTFEHWASLYIASRFPRENQWWPSRGEDIALGLRDLMYRGPLGAPAKIIMLELKVPEWNERTQRHTLRVGRSQLDAYLAPAPSGGYPVFYVLPDPRWPGPLAVGSAHALGASVNVAGLWRGRSGPEWFGYWTWVVSASALKAVLQPGPANPTLYTLGWDGAGAPQSTGTLPLAIPGALPWREFWRAVTTCGPVGSTRWGVDGDGLWRDLNNPSVQLEMSDARLTVEGEASTAVVSLSRESLLG